MAGDMSFHPKAKTGVTERPAEGIPEEIAGHVRKKNGEHEAEESDKAEIGGENDPKAYERGDISQEDRGKIDDKISPKGVSTDRRRNQNGHIVHPMSIPLPGGLPVFLEKMPQISYIKVVLMVGKVDFDGASSLVVKLRSVAAAIRVRFP